jgi:hypothetical protein
MKLLYGFLLASLLVACTPTGLRSPGPSDEYAWTNKNNARSEQVRSELKQCGDGYLTSNLRPRSGESTDNAAARQEECMFTKGYYIKSGDGGYCSNPYYRSKLPACLNAPVRPRQGYYGQ